MLVLSRKNGQKIIINDDIEITILDSRFDNCKIAIKAPKDVKIYREEVYQEIQFANRMGNKTSVESLENIDSILNIDLACLQKQSKVIVKKKKD